MKLLLVAVNAKFIHTNLAIYSLHAYAKKYEEHMELAEYTINHREEEILKGIYRRKADVVAFSCYIWNIEIILSVARELKKVCPHTQIWLGGPEVSYDSKELLKKYSYIDGIIIGEGEQTFLELMECWLDHSIAIKDIHGIAYRSNTLTTSVGKEDQASKEEQDKAICVTPNREPLSLDELPFPYERLDEFQHKIIYYESSRGCPFSCSYCLSSIDQRVRLRSLELVMKELQRFLDAKIPQVKFVDRTFNCNKKHAMGIWRYLKEMDNGITNFHFEIAADLLDDEEIQLLSTLRPGQVQFEIGVQSTNPKTISIIQRTMRLDKLTSNVKRIQEGHNIHQHLDLIAGLPMEDYQSFAKSFQDVYSLRPDQLQLGFLKVLKGSLMEEQIKEYGIVYQDRAPYEVLMTQHLTYDELIKLKLVAEMVEIYYNSGQFDYSIKFLEHFYSNFMELYQELGNYYENQGLELLAHSRIRRYEILLEFYQYYVISDQATDQRNELLELFKEIMAFDLYLREKMKTRPSFLGDGEKVPKDLGKLRGADHRELHIESFHYDILASCNLGTPVKKSIRLLFDYSNRDPLNKAARVEILND